MTDKKDKSLIEEVDESLAKRTYQYKDPKTGEIYEYDRRGVYKKDGRTLIPVR